MKTGIFENGAVPGETGWLAVGPSERLTVDFSNLDQSTLNLVIGQSGDPLSPYYIDHWPYWYRGTTFRLPFSDAAVSAAAAHTLTLVP